MLIQQRKGWQTAAMVLGLAFAGHSLAQDTQDSITGYWRTIDDRTGFAKGIVRVDKKPDGTYSGTVVKATPRPGYTPQEFCVNCPAPYTGKRIVGITHLTGLKPVADNDHAYEGGKIMDPLSGKVYSCKARLSADGRRLSMRGYVGVSLLGRSQSWIRETDPKMLEGIEGYRATER